MATRKLVVYPDMDLMIQAGAQRFALALLDLLAERLPDSTHRTRVDVALSGGSAAQPLGLVLDDPLAEAIDWSRVHFWWSDERFVPAYDTDRNALEARRLLLDKLVADGKLGLGDEPDVCVPTGNFGNILAAYYAKRMGVPLGMLYCASNENRVLTDFINTGTYDISERPFVLTPSPSMDILVSSNLERLLYLSCGRDAAKTKAMMEQLSTNGKYEITADMKEFMKDFCAGYADMEENAKEIRKVFDDTGYLIDTHTGVAAAVYEQYKAKTGDTTKTVIASTASPYKFSRSVMEAVLGKKKDADEFALIDEMERISGVKIPQAIEEIRDAKILHNRQCKPEEMEETVKQTFSK